MARHGGIHWVEVFHPVMHASVYVRCPYKGHGVGCMWHLLRPMTVFQIRHVESNVSDMLKMFNVYA